MKRKLFFRPGWWLSVNAAFALLAGGCATEEEQSFNDTFNQNLAVAPKYAIEDVHDDHFKIRMHQGSPLDDPSRVTSLKNAMTIVAQDECRRRGWANWDVNYIQERDQGWMHVLVADVREKSAVEVTPLPPTPPPTAPPPQ